jgi:peroxiredoxin
MTLSLLLVSSLLAASCESDSGDEAQDLNSSADYIAAEDVATSDCGSLGVLADGACAAPDVAPQDLSGADNALGDDLPTADSAGLDAALPDVTQDLPADVPVDVAEVQPETVVPDFPLEVGDKVPDFSLKAHDGSTFVLSEQAGKNVLISSYPAAQTSVCEWQTCYVNDHYDEFIALNTVPVGLSSDYLGKLANWAQEQAYKQLLLSDTTPVGEVSKMFGIWTESMGVTTRALLVIDAQGVLVYKKVFAMGAKPDFDALFTFLQGLAK